MTITTRPQSPPPQIGPKPQADDAGGAKPEQKPAATETAQPHSQPGAAEHAKLDSPASAEAPHRDGVEAKDVGQNRKAQQNLDAGSVHSGPKSREAIKSSVDQQVAGAHVDDESRAHMQQELRHASAGAPTGASASLGQGPATKSAKLGPGKHAYGTTAQDKLNPKLDSKTIDTPDKLKKKHVELDGKLQKLYPGGVNFKPPYKSGSADEAHAKWALLHLPKQAGKEGDHIANLNGKKTMLTLRAEDKKVGGQTKTAVEVEVLGTKTPKVAKSFKTEAEAIKALETEYKVKVATSPKAFKLDELNKVYTAFKKLGPDEKKGLEGVRLERVSNVGKNRAAEFNFKEKTTGSPPNKAVDRDAAIRIGDETFKHDETRFVGGKKDPTFPSVRTILHEAGHAVETKERRDALQKKVKAEVDHDNANHGNEQAFDTWLSSAKSMPGRSPHRKAALRFHKAGIKVQKALNALHSAPESQIKAKRAALDKAVAARDKAFAAMDTATPGYDDAKAWADGQNKMVGLSQGVADARATAAKHETPKTRGDKTKSKSERLNRFDAYVKKNRIKPFTDYAASHHKGGGEEFYAEAFSLYKTDPEWLQKNSPLLFDYFKNGEHLKE